MLYCVPRHSAPMPAVLTTELSFGFAFLQAFCLTTVSLQGWFFCVLLYVFFSLLWVQFSVPVRFVARKHCCPKWSVRHTCNVSSAVLNSYQLSLTCCCSSAFRKPLSLIRQLNFLQSSYLPWPTRLVRCVKTVLRSCDPFRSVHLCSLHC